MPPTLRKQETSRDLVLDPVARIKKLSEHGGSVEIDKTIPVKRYLRSGSEMERQARVYYTEGQWDRAFMLYNKFATLFIEKLPKHPEYPKASPTEKARIKKLLKEAVLPRAMDVKEKLKTKYEKEKEDLERAIKEESEVRAERERMEAQQKKAQEEELQRQSKMEAQKEAEQVAKFLQGEGGVAVSSNDDQETMETEDHREMGRESPVSDKMGYPAPPPMTTPNTTSAANEDVIVIDSNDDDPVKGGQFDDTAAHSGSRDSPVEIDRAGATPTSENLTTTDYRLAQVLPTAPATAVVMGSVTSPYQVQPSAPPPPTQLLTQSQQQQAQFTPASQPGASQPGAAPYQPTPPPNYAAYQQPPPTNYSSYQQQQQATPPPYNPMVVTPTTPPVAMSPALQQPTYERSIFQSPFTSPPNATPTSDTTGWTSSPVTPTPTPVVDRSTKPNSLKALSTDCWTAGVDGYRPLLIPRDTAAKFEEVAMPNTTRRNVETCGILAGKLSQNTLRITHIIVPKQKGKADSCETLNEEELFDVQDQYDLITLGWIHTHPTQTAFMSSVDLHCHCSYQVMMDEAVAIVVAPKYKQVGYYMLTEPHGLNYITHCEEEGFHVHPKEPPLYEECKHIHHDQNTFIQIVDLR